MKILVINQSRVRAPRKFIQRWCEQIEKEFLKRRLMTKTQTRRELTVVFLDPKAARKTNQQYRGKDYATDVLSFESLSPDHFGDLVLCPQVLRRQAQEHGLSYQEELGYMLLHGVLHLLGYDHETSPQEAEKMFRIQDSVFEILLES